MIFTELRFLVFLAVAWSVHWALSGHRARKAWLLLASCVFYGAWDWRFLALMLATIVTDWAVGLGLERAQDEVRRRALLVVSVALNLGVLGFFKYWNFFAESAEAALRGLGFEAHAPTLRVILPVGISFYTFQSISYTIDVYRRRLPACRSLVDFALFVAFFPQLVAGPIVRATDFLPQLARNPVFASIRWRRCALVFLIGYVKKAVIADHVGEAIDPYFAEPGSHGPRDAWLAALLYTVQNYCDFSGYSDMATGLAGAFGYRLCLNFDFPYLARTVAEFRRRWHISLTDWFRDYLYVPLGGNRHGPVRMYVNLTIVFFLAGLWHGAAWTFVAWGLYYAVLLLVERVAVTPVLDRLPPLAGHVWTLVCILVGQSLFRSQDFGKFWTMLGAMFTGAAGADTIPVAWVLLVVACLAVHVALYRGVLVPAAERLPWWGFAATVGVVASLILPWVSRGYTPFIYFQF